MVVAPLCNPISLQYLSLYTDHYLQVVPMLAKLLSALSQGLSTLQNEVSSSDSLNSLLPVLSIEVKLSMKRGLLVIDTGSYSKANIMEALYV